VALAAAAVAANATIIIPIIHPALLFFFALIAMLIFLQILSYL
jgi:hypothetical protein